MSLNFAEFNLNSNILKAVAKEGYETPTPIQAKSIPLALLGRDIMAGAQTGTGKTAAFTLPLLNQLSSSTSTDNKAVRALVLTPTRELADQVGNSVKTYGQFLKISSAIIYGGMSMNPQVSALRRRPQIIVATPGRLLDHCRQRNVDLSKIEILVLDEADRMLDMGFIHDIRTILSMLPVKKQTLLFSATFPSNIRQLAKEFMHEPELISVVGENSAAKTITQEAYAVKGDQKKLFLKQLLDENAWRNVLVFSKTKHGANKLSEWLTNCGIASDAIHGNKSQPARTKALTRFKKGDIRVLVATDVAARGIDIDQLAVVVNYDLSNVPEDYVHRIGRTGRAGATGKAISLVSQDDRKNLYAIERLLKVKFNLIVPNIVGVEPLIRLENNSKNVSKREEFQHDNRSFQIPRNKKRRTSASSQNDNRGVEKTFNNGYSSQKVSLEHNPRTNNFKGDGFVSGASLLGDKRNEPSQKKWKGDTMSGAFNPKFKRNSKPSHAHV